ncbi:unnamed protein product, partial [Discosporangium mesarthrocarpum]
HGGTSNDGGVVSGKKSEGGGREVKNRNINMEAAALHAVTDLVQSVGILLAGLLIWYNPKWKWADPVVTLMFVVLVRGVGVG